MAWTGLWAFSNLPSHPAPSGRSTRPLISHCGPISCRNSKSRTNSTCSPRGRGRGYLLGRIIVFTDHEFSFSLFPRSRPSPASLATHLPPPGPPLVHSQAASMSPCIAYTSACTAQKLAAEKVWDVTRSIGSYDCRCIGIRKKGGGHSRKETIEGPLLSERGVVPHTDVCVVLSPPDRPTCCPIET